MIEQTRCHGWGTQRLQNRRITGLPKEELDSGCTEILQPLLEPAILPLCHPAIVMGFANERAANR